MPKLFEDLLVIDCASFIAGPAAGTIMADFGARVIKIEPPGIGDSYRQMIKVPGMPTSDQDYFWLLDNRNKESLALDLKHEASRPVLEALLRKADVFITNFPGPIRQRLRLREEDICPVNARLIYASLTPFGETGPDKDRTGYDATAWWARSGLMDHVRPDRNGSPSPSVPGMGDHPTAMALFGAIVSALYRREKTGLGGSVSTSLLANGLWSLGCYMQAACCDADFSARLGRGHRSALIELYRGRCGRWFMLAMVNQQREWPLLIAAIGKPEWGSDPRFATPEARKANSGELVRELEAVFAQRDWEDWKSLLGASGVTYEPVTLAQDHFSCEQIEANGFLPEIEETGGLRTVDSPIRIAGEEKCAPRKAPTIGQHTRDVLIEAGFDGPAIERLFAAGAVA